MKNQTTVEKAVQAEEIVKEEVTECKDAAEKPAKKPAKAKKAAPAKEAAPSNVRANITIEYQFRNTTIQSIMDKILEAEEGNSINKLAVYIQPENGVAYYVVNDQDEGKSVDL